MSWWSRKEKPLYVLYPFQDHHDCPKCGNSLLNNGIYVNYITQEYIRRQCYGCDAVVRTEVKRKADAVVR